jgi:hypothetical protein
MAPYLPSLRDLVAVLITWGIGAALLVIGTGLTGRNAGAEFRIVAGWGGLCLPLTFWGVFVPVSLWVAVTAVGIAALTMQLRPARRVHSEDWRVIGRMLLVSLPLWAVMAPIRPSQVDTFLNLLPNAFYLVDYARLPTAASPPSFSFLPAAPYNTQFLSFLGSAVDPDYAAAGMSLINVMLLLAAGVAVARMLSARAQSPVAAPPWALIALGMLLVTLFNPGFVPRVHFAAYGETALATTALLAACLFLDRQAALAAGRRPSQLATISLILAAMVNSKQSAIGLVMAVVGAAIAIGLAERAVRRTDLVKGAVLALAPAAFLYGLWRYFVAHAGVDELTPLPFDAWNWDTLPATLASLAAAIAGKPVYFGGVAIALVCFPVFLRRQGWTPLTRLLGFHAAAFALYNGFLILTYIAHFSREMSIEAHSYFRYNTHLSLVLVLTLALGAREIVAPLWRGYDYRRPLAEIALALALLAPLAFAERLRFDLAMPQPMVWDLAKELKPYLKDGDRVALLLPGDDHDIGTVLAGFLAVAPPRRRALDILRRQTADAATLDEVATAGYGLAVITCTPAQLAGLPAGVAALVEHDARGWHQVAAWPYREHPRPTRWQRVGSWPALCD